ncbi:BMA-HUM-2 [Dirofilaria immitis]|nr:BMA-HUM-2 [Dirofilaria immitis]
MERDSVDYGLVNERLYFYTAQRDSGEIESVDDRNNFLQTVATLDLLGISADVKKLIFHFFAGFLLFANICFIDGNDEYARIGRNTSGVISQLCKRIYEVKQDDLGVWLNAREIVAGDESVCKPLTTAEKINEALGEQIKSTAFKLEQSEYEREEINWIWIDFYYNQSCIDLIENKPGIIDYLDEQYKIQFLSDIQRNTPVFIIKHFAADVIYNVDSFLAMNKDTVSEHLITVMKKSKVNDSNINNVNLSGSFNNCEACGVLETMRISAAGYLSRWIHEDFARRYRLVYPEKKLWHEKQKFLQKNYAINILGQVRVEGDVKLLDNEQAGKYFSSRARNSQISAWCVPSARVVLLKEYGEKGFTFFTNTAENDRLWTIATESDKMRAEMANLETQSYELLSIEKRTYGRPLLTDSASFNYHISSLHSCYNNLTKQKKLVNAKIPVVITKMSQMREQLLVNANLLANPALSIRFSQRSLNQPILVTGSNDVVTVDGNESSLYIQTTTRY